MKFFKTTIYLLIAIFISNNMAIAQFQNKITIVLKPFKLNGEFPGQDFSWVPEGFPDLLQGKFNQYYPKNIRIVSRERTNMLIEEIQLSQAGFTESEEAVDPGKFFAADFIIWGSVMTHQVKEILISTKIIDIKTSEQTTITVSGNINKWPFQHSDSLVKKLYSELVSLKKRPVENIKKVVKKTAQPQFSRIDEGQIISAKSMSATARFYKALDHIANNEWMLGETALKRAIELDPDFARAYVNLGYIYMELGKFTQAKDQYNKALTIFPNSDIAYTNLGLLYANLKMYDKSINYLEQALKISPGNCETLTELAKAYYSTAQYYKAEQIFSQVLAIDSLYISSYYYFGLLEVKKNKFDNAVVQWNKVIENSEPFFRPVKIEAYKKIGFYWLSIRKEPAKAIEFYTKAKDLALKHGTEPQLFNILLYQAKAYIENGEAEKAQPDLAKIVETQPDNSDARLYYAISLYKNDHLDRCISELEILLKMESGKKHHERARKILKQLRGY